MSDSKRTIKVTWDSGLQISKGDEVEILRGIVGHEGEIRATLMKNKTTGRKERSMLEGVAMLVRPTDIKPPISGIVGDVEALSNETRFDLVIGAGLIEVGLGRLLQEASKFLDEEIVDKCIRKKDAEDILTSAFRILEERIREKIGASHELHGVDLINEAFHHRTGKLVFGDTEAEREGLFLLFRSSLLFLRNPPSHRFVQYSDFQIFEMVCVVDLLLSILDKSQARIEQPEEPEARVKKLGKRSEKKARKKEYPVNVVKEVYGPLYSDIKGIILALEKKWYKYLDFDTWRAMQYDERHFVVDEEFEKRLDGFLESLQKYSDAVVRLRKDILPNIMSEQSEREFKVKVEQISLRIKYKHARGLTQTSPNIVDCLISQTHPKDYVLQKAPPESEIAEFEILFGSVLANSTITAKFDAFWKSCEEKTKKNVTHNFVIGENDNLLKEARNLEKEIAKRIKEHM